MQALQPMQRLAVTCTVLPIGSTWLAPVGQHCTHGGLSQWLQRSERISIVSVGKVPRTSVVIQSRQKPVGTSFSVWQATTQSMQPTHLAVSITIPKRAIYASTMNVTKLLWMLVPPISGSVLYFVVRPATLAPRW